MTLSGTSAAQSPFSLYRRAAACSIALALAGCHPAQDTSNAPQKPDVLAVTVHKTSVPITVDLPGRTTPYLIAEVRARVDGIVRQRFCQEGSDVTAGQRLYKIDPGPYQVALDSARAAQQKAAANLNVLTVQANRFKTLVDGNTISRQTYDKAVASRKQAAADVATANAAIGAASINLHYTDVAAPIAGRTALSLITQGAYVQASAATLMTTIQQIDPIYVDVTETSVAGLQLRRDLADGKLRQQAGKKADVTLTLEDGTPYGLKGKLEFNGITVDQSTGLVTLRALFPKTAFSPCRYQPRYARRRAGTDAGGRYCPSARRYADAGRQLPRSAGAADISGIWTVSCYFLALTSLVRESANDCFRVFPLQMLKPCKNTCPE